MNFLYGNYTIVNFDWAPISL